VSGEEEKKSEEGKEALGVARDFWWERTSRLSILSREEKHVATGNLGGKVQKVGRRGLCYLGGKLYPWRKNSGTEKGGLPWHRGQRSLKASLNTNYKQIRMYVRGSNFRGNLRQVNLDR